MAHKKGVGSTDNGRDSHSKRLGVKLFGGEEARAGNIIIRQRGTKFHPGRNVGLGKDHTIYALKDGFVRFHKKRKNRTYVSIIPTEDVIAAMLRERENGQENGSAHAKDTQTETDSERAAEQEAGSEEAETREEQTKDKEEQTEPTQQEAASEQQQDDLKKLDGVGPKTAEVLHAAGINTFDELASKTSDEIKAILIEEGSRFGHFDTSSWPEQAKYLSKGDQEGLDAYLNQLKEEE